ncbi:MAG: MMPL family transporter, partial [Candidatus Methylomirabilales bacterium]
ALAEADARARGEEVIARRDSIIEVLADELPEARAGPLKRLSGLLEPVVLDPSRLAPVDRAALRASIEELQAVFERALDGAATAGGLEQTSRLLDQVVSILEAAAKTVESAPAGWERELETALGKVWGWARDRKDEVLQGLALGPAQEQDLPAEVLGKLKGARSGRYVLYLHPKEDLRDRAAVERFVAAARRVHPEATGYPIVFFASTSLIHRGFSTAVAAAAAVIFITLFLDFRRITLVLLATLPKGLGIVWMLGIMRLLGLNYNLANQIVIPLLIGVGLAFGIHIIHRFFMARPGERDITDVLEHTGGAIVLSGLTTMIGFGSLALASHRGLASMGTVLFFGVGAALVTST